MVTLARPPQPFYPPPLVPSPPLYPPAVVTAAIAPTVGLTSSAQSKPDDRGRFRYDHDMILGYKSKDTPQLTPFMTTSNTRPAAATAAVPSTLTHEARERFRKESISLLSTFPERKLPVVQFPTAFAKQFDRPFLLVDYGGKKLVQLIQAIPDTLKVHCTCSIRFSVFAVKRWWCNGQHCCLPSSRSGFVSRPTHVFCFFFSKFFLCFFTFCS